MRNKENSMLISFDDVPENLRWSTCLSALNSEYTLTFKDMCKILKCSRSWAVKYLKPHLHYIYLSNGAGGKSPNYVRAASKMLNKKMTETTWYSFKEFSNFIKENIGEVTRQTIRIPVELIIDTNKKEYFDENYISTDEILDNMDDIEKFEKMLEKRENVLQKCASEQGKKILDDLPSKYNRRMSKSVDCDYYDFDITNLMAVHDLKDYGDSDEEIYRDLFDKGCYKIVLRIPDSDGCVSEKIYYVKDKNEFKGVRTREFILINYSNYVSLCNNI